MSILLLATDRGIWRRDYAPGLDLRKEEFHVDAPGRAALSIAGGAQAAVVLVEGERLLVWEDEARLFREEALFAEDGSRGASASDPDDGGSDAQPSEELVEPGGFEDFEDFESFEDEGLGLELVYLGPSGTRYLGACPPAVIQSRPGAHGEALGELGELPEAAQWRGLEAPYEPRVTALLEPPSTGATTSEDASPELSAAAPDLYATVSVGGLVRHRADGWESVAPTELPRDLRSLAWAHERLWLGGGQGLWWMKPDPFECRRASLPPSAAFVSRILALPAAGLLVAAAGGPPATWRGPDGSRMSLWHFADENGVGRPIAGPFHGVITGLAFDGEAALATTDDGELWRAPLAGPAPAEPLLADLPRANGLFLVAAGGGQG